MIVAVGFCPSPPALVPAVGGSAADELAELRSACAAVVDDLVGTGGQLLLLGAGPTSMVHSPLARGDLAPWGVPLEVHLGSPACGGSVELPLSLTVGAWLVRDVAGPRTSAMAVSVGPDYAASRAAADLVGIAEQQDVALLVLGDGSARRTLKAPGYLDPRAEAFDAEVARALATGDVAALAGVDAELGGALLAAGVPVWRAAADLITAPIAEAELRYDAAPFGVGYLVAHWRLDA